MLNFRFMATYVFLRVYLNIYYVSDLVGRYYYMST